MKRKASVSKSTYRAILQIQKDRDKKSGIYISDRFFKPDTDTAKHHIFWAFTDFIVLFCLLMGLFIMLTSGFFVSASSWFYPALTLICLVTVLIFRNDFCKKYWYITFFVLLLAYLTCLFIFQTSIIIGAKQFIYLVVDTLNKVYKGELDIIQDETGRNISEIFLVFLAVPVSVWLAVSLFWSNQRIMTYILVFPLLALMVLSGAANNIVALFMLLFGIILCMSYSRTKRQFRMWGGNKKSLFSENSKRFQSVQKRSSIAVLIASIVLSIPGFLIVMPMLSLSLKPMEKVALNVRSDFLNQVLKILPKISAGEWNLSFDAVSGGVAGGSLAGNEGIQLDAVEDLKIAVDKKPSETLFLKGFVGSKYKDGSWETDYGSSFDGAAINWKTEGSPRLYIQNLPFLRTTYVLGQKKSDVSDIAEALRELNVSTATMEITLVNASDDYTYVPYGVYLNNFYEVEAGDAYIKGLTEKNSKFYFFYRNDMDEALGAWNELENTSNVLDRVEDAYSAFCVSNNLGNVVEGLDELETEIGELIKSNKWKTDENLDDITAWIRKYLTENYSYELNPGEVPAGRDPLDYFLFESKKGNSVHFASAAVILFRMFGIPARYVVGYEIPAALFTAQPGGTYTATAQGDNSQAWSEIYVKGIGWVPKDMTPGVIGSYEEVGPGGEKIEADVAKPDESQKEEESNESQEIEKPDNDNLTVVNNSFIRWLKKWSVKQIIIFFVIIISVVIIVVVSVIITIRVCRAYGYDPFRRRGYLNRMTWIFQALYKHMQKKGLPDGYDSQSEEFMTFCEEYLDKRSEAASEDFRKLVDRLYECTFGNGIADEQDVLNMRNIYKASKKKAKK